MKAEPHPRMESDPIEKLRHITDEVERAVCLAKRVRQEVESALSSAEHGGFPAPHPAHD